MEMINPIAPAISHAVLWLLGASLIQTLGSFILFLLSNVVISPPGKNNIAIPIKVKTGAARKNFNTDPVVSIIPYPIYVNVPPKTIARNPNNLPNFMFLND